MGISNVLSLLCGLALFLYGMGVMGDALKKSAGRKLKTILGNLTSNKFKGFLLGLGVTAIIQSSSATTVMVVGFVTSGTMLLSQAIGVIMGANVGTAVTAWLTALNSIPGGGDAMEWTNWLKPDAWMPILAVIGIGLIMFAKSGKKQDVGAILVGFAVLMIGMSMMSDAVSGLKNDEGFKSILTMFSNPILGVLAGTLLTAIVQSSSASVGILQALSSTGAISFSAAMPIIMGQNIGTCVTAIISSVSANKSGKRAAFVHLYFNVIGVILWLGLYYLIGWIVSMAGAFDVFNWASSTMVDGWWIAGIHTVFKIFSVLVLFPVSKLLEKLAYMTVKGDDKKGDDFTSMLDDRLLATPTVAIDRSRTVTCRMAEISIDAMNKAITMLNNYDGKVCQEIRAAEDKADIYEDVLGSYLVKLSSRDMSAIDSHETTKLLHMIGDFERISDHSVNLIESAEEIKDKDIHFSDTAVKELNVLYGAVSEIMTITKEAFIENDLNKANAVEPLEQVVDYLKEHIKHNHTIRLQKSECSIELGFILADVLTNLERVADHCSNIAGCLIEMSRHESLDLHNYLSEVRTNDLEYAELYKKYMEKYAL
ncbi:MAG: Na/Pi cotransporter family protein [Ruminococcaceae bacterium]|nr:Na/Pi cotransporter family protein [Oscillospiraceae bacterium]